MKFTVNSKELQQALTLASGAIHNNPVVPILNDFCMELKGRTLTVAATDLEVSVVTEIDVAGTGEGTIAVPAKILLDTIKALPDQPVTIAVSDTAVDITTDVGSYSISAEDAADFPEMPIPEGSSDFVLEPEVLNSAIKNTLFAVSNDELRQALTGIHFNFANKLEIVATNAHKLAKYTVDVDSKLDAFTVPAKAIKLIKGVNQTVGVTAHDSHAYFTFGNTRVACRLIDARYPDYNAVIPDNPHTLEVDRQELLGALKRVINFATETTNLVKLTIDETGFTVSAEDMDYSHKANESLHCAYDGEDMSIGFNARFLIEMLSTLDAVLVGIDLDTPTRAAVLYPLGTEEGILMMAMPVMLGEGGKK
jgi:DNA polymerase-3 subunit beta